MTSSVDAANHSESVGTYRRLLMLSKAYLLSFSIGALATIGVASIDAGIAWFVKPIVDRGLVAQDSLFVRWLVPGVIIAFLLRGSLGFISEYLLYRTGRNIVLTLREKLFAHYLKLPVHLIEHTSVGQLISTMIYNVDRVAIAATESVLILVKDGATSIALLVVMTLISWQLTICCLLSAPVIALVVRIVSKHLRRYSVRSQESMADVTHVTEEAIRSHRLIRMYEGMLREFARFSKHALINRTQEVKVVAANAIASSIVQFAASLPLALAFWIISNQSGKISVGAFVAVALAMGRLLEPIKRLTRVNTEIQKGAVAAKSIFSWLDQPPEVDHGIQTLGRAKGHICFQNLSFQYLNNTENSLSDINLEILPGQVVALVGQSGAGKSTLMNLLPRFYTPSSGQILLDKVDLQDLTLQDLRRQFAYVGQELSLFNDTISANIAYGSPNIASEGIIEAAKSAQAWDFISRLPQGIDTLIGEGGVRLSAGQKQRIAIARALCRDAPLLILDEATSNLDSETEQRVQTALSALLKGRTALIIAHRLSTIQNADRILVMDEGRVVEEGTHQTLLANSGHYARFYEAQFVEGSR